SRAIKKGGFLGLFQKNYVEVIAALDEDDSSAHISTPITMPNKEHLPSLNREQDPILEEMQQLRKLISTQQTVTKQQFLPPFEYAFQYLQRQEKERSIAEEWIKEIADDTSNIEVAIPDIKQFLLEKMEKEIEDVLTLNKSNNKSII